jgi:hypothetical protein
MLSYVCYSHKDYNDIWPMVFGQIDKNIKGFEKILFTSSFSSETDTNITNYFDSILTFDEKLEYPERLIYLCEQVKSKYIALVHDNDIVMNFDTDLCKTYLSLMEKQNIDRMMFGVLAKRTSPEEDFFVDANITNSKHFLTPYDVGPSIWNKTSLCKVMTEFKNCSYREIEFSGIQNYCKNHFNMVGLRSEIPNQTKYSIGRPFTSKHSFCHIICQGKWMEPYAYMDYAHIIPKMITDYNIQSTRGILYNQFHIDINNRDV